MDARLIRFTHLDRETFAPTLAWLGENAVPKLAALSGYRTILLGVNPEDCLAVAVIFWDSGSTLKRSLSVETPLRDEALQRAGGKPEWALTDSFEVMVNVAGDAQPQWVRMARWVGLTPPRARAGHELYQERMVPALRRLPGFAGTFSAADFRNGKVLGAFFWESREAMEASYDWERETVSELDEVSGPRRPIMADSYQVATVPELEPAATPG